MELIDRKSLDKILFTKEIRDQYKLSTQDKNSITNQLAEAVSYMHRQECPVIHADNKPANIIITHQPNLVVQLCDFGLSKLVDVAMTIGTTCGDAVGTPIYMASELLLHSGKNTTSSNVWALGCSIIEIDNEKYTWNAKSKTELAK
ncbi:CBL-interacting serine/threonine-protein kinase 8-like [Aphidius gifuensis]|nr:CBL-interacting serine/threonine-protein kinase 8-like [Aphidius gifuensis]